MTPSTEQQKEMSEGQINKAVASHRALLEKYAPQFDAVAVQQVLGDPEYVAEQVAVLRKRVEAVSGLIVHHVTVNRTRSPQEAIDATGRSKYLTDSVVASMPQGMGDEAEVFFFKLGRYISDADLDKEYELRGLKPADPYTLAAVNEADPAFADDHPNSTHWEDVDGKWCYAAFDRLDDERGVDVDRSGGEWGGAWWFAGCRK